MSDQQSRRATGFQALAELFEFFHFEIQTHAAEFGKRFARLELMQRDGSLPSTRLEARVDRAALPLERFDLFETQQIGVELQ